MSVVVLPDSGEIVVQDVVAVARETSAFEFILNAGLSLRSDSGSIQRIGTSADGLRTAYRVTLETPARLLKLHYRGRPVFSERPGMGDMPQGIVAPEGVYLDGSSAWYPLFDRAFDAFSLTVAVPEGWQGLSIGGRSEQDGAVRWSSDRPHDDLYLIAGPFTRHARQHRDIELSVWLLDDDPPLAMHYLDLMGAYIDDYAKLIGAYPYAKFAVVENRWQTGFGMPSFTLLGSRVIRLPFIPYTSLPHEILHNWWGNGVWVDHAKGNWSEGLTAYLADHWMQEREGKGAQYRLKALQGYSNYAAQGRDMPLLQFVSRHNEATQSVGYSKSLMLFHMLRRAQGDAAFVTGLQRLWQQHRYSSIGFAQTVQTLAGEDTRLAQRFRQWLERPGAPRLRLGEVEVHREAGGYRLVLPLSQDQDPPFALDIPVAVTLEGELSARRLYARLASTAQRFEFSLPGRPLRIDVDPEFDVLRYLDASEQPPALSRLFGGDSWLVLPRAAAPDMYQAWRALAEQWQTRYPGLRLIDDDAAQPTDPQANRILLGWDNRQFAGSVGQFRRDDQQLLDDALLVGDRRYVRASASVALVSTDAQGVATGFIGAPTPGAVQVLARKLTHYGSFGRLVFDAQTGENRLRDSLPSTHSALSRQLGTAPVPLRLEPLPALQPPPG